MRELNLKFNAPNDYLILRIKSLSFSSRIKLFLTRHGSCEVNLINIMNC